MTLLKSLSLLAVAAGLLAACDEAPARVMQLNPNTFTIVATSFSDSVDARQRALSEAVEHCNMRGLELSSQGGTNSQALDWLGERVYNHELRFQCLPHGTSMGTAAPQQVAAPVANVQPARSEPVVVIVR